jgi:tripartite-type tricarboxylate transporter receptor subunit TctC
MPSVKASAAGAAPAAWLRQSRARPPAKLADARWLGATPAGGTSDAFGEFVKTEMSHWAQVVKEAGLKVQQ